MKTDDLNHPGIYQLDCHEPGRWIFAVRLRLRSQVVRGSGDAVGDPFGDAFAALRAEREQEWREDFFGDTGGAPRA